MRISKKTFLIGIGAVAALLGLGMYGFYSGQAASIRHPAVEHAHMRLQLIINGEAVNFGSKKYQNTYDQGVCSDALSEQPIHFHDNKDQFVHLHWKRISGGMILKHYGWNLIGGADGLHGYRFDKLPSVSAVPIYGAVLPAKPGDAQLWIYAGDETGYQERAVQDFLTQDIETFFNKKSLVNPTAMLPNLFLARAAAHNGIDHDALVPAVQGVDSTAPEKTQQELARINNLLGNVVIFAQKDRPSEKQIKERFNHLEPLADSTCGG